MKKNKQVVQGRTSHEGLVDYLTSNFPVYTVDGRNPKKKQLISSLSHNLQGCFFNAYHMGFRISE